MKRQRGDYYECLRVGDEANEHPHPFSDGRTKHEGSGHWSLVTMVLFEDLALGSLDLIRRFVDV